VLLLSKRRPKTWRPAGGPRLGSRWPTTARADEAPRATPPASDDTAGKRSCAFLHAAAPGPALRFLHPSIPPSSLEDRITTKSQACHFYDPQCAFSEIPVVRWISRSLPLRPLLPLPFACPCRGTPWGESVPPAHVFPARNSGIRSIRKRLGVSATGSFRLISRDRTMPVGERAKGPSMGWAAAGPSASAAPRDQEPTRSQEPALHARPCGSGNAR
jgi:hypothetical protein